MYGPPLGNGQSHYQQYENKFPSNGGFVPLPPGSSHSTAPFAGPPGYFPSQPAANSHHGGYPPTQAPVQTPMQSVQQPVLQHGKPAPWKSGFFARAPFMSFVAIGVALAACAAMGVILTKADRQPIDDWTTVSPTVLLAITTTVANPALHFAFGSAIDVAWWSRSLDKNRKLGDLHHTWALGASLGQTLKHAISHPYKFGVLVAILNGLVNINAPFLQRAITVSTTPVTSVIPLNLLASRELPQGFTASVEGRNKIIGFTQPAFGAIAQQYFTQQPIQVDPSVAAACAGGTCRGTMQGAGYDFGCFTTTIEIPSPSSPEATGDGFDVYNSTIEYDEAVYANGSTPKVIVEVGDPTFNYATVYKPSPGCSGTMRLSQCTIRSALVTYPIVITNGTLTLDPTTTYHDDTIVRHTPPEIFRQAPARSTHGGIALVLEGLFTSSSTTRFSGARGWSLNNQGSALVYQYASVNSSELGDEFACPVSWRDATPDVLAAARELIFRTAVGAANASLAQDQQTVQATQDRTVTIFVVNYAFAAVSLAVTLVTSLAILPLFAGFWRLGRTVSLSPLEIAKAFGAAPVAGVASNTDADGLLKQAGKLPICYGAVTGTDGRTQLKFARSDIVQRPKKGREYAG
ncbi:hypothetical protein B0T25DRAFT_247599 [Lasiosphaeria hispida]|uniref:Uncharacterized protein n=1 Tax=Lasiosphaeria hispida TaxID=260671 RepID=A0AAJ0HF25_9PEZI|nr:hypothetical protein B0T25DRAFT_247599 [Lasiosphaeria hispida]